MGSPGYNNSELSKNHKTNLGPNNCGHSSLCVYRVWVPILFYLFTDGGNILNDSILYSFIAVKFEKY